MVGENANPTADRQIGGTDVLPLPIQNSVFLTDGTYVQPGPTNGPPQIDDESVAHGTEGVVTPLRLQRTNLIRRTITRQRECSGIDDDAPRRRVAGDDRGEDRKRKVIERADPQRVLKEVVEHIDTGTHLGDPFTR